MNGKQAVLALCLSFLLCAVCHAGIRPSLYVDNAAWSATDIVVLSQNRDHVEALTVVEVWDGSLAVGDKLTMPELAKFAKEENRTVGRPPFAAPRQENDKDTDPPKVVPSNRILLFLRRDGAQDKGNPPALAPQQWKFASWSEPEGSSAFLTPEGVYAFHQFINPGPTILVRENFTETELKMKVEAIAKVRNELIRIATIQDGEKRARAAETYTDSHTLNAPDEAFRILMGCGDAGLQVIRRVLCGNPTPHEQIRAIRALAIKADQTDLPLLRAILRDDSRTELHPEALRGFATVGGKEVAPELVAMLNEDLAFWRKTAPDLEPGWRSGRGLAEAQVEPLRSRYSRTVAVLRALGTIKPKECREPVVQFRDFWRSLPQLEDKFGPSQMSRECDAVLKGLGEAGGRP